MRFILVFIVLGLASTSFSQVISRQIVGTASWLQVNDELKFSASLGQPVSGTIYSPLGRLSQGFQQSPQYVELVAGCTNAEACNYNEEASISDESCDYVSCLIGCTEPEACNFDPLVIADDGSCDFSCCPGPGCCNDGTHWDELTETCVVTFPADINFDGCVQLNDLLDLLSDYGGCLAE